MEISAQIKKLFDDHRDELADNNTLSIFTDKFYTIRQSINEEELDQFYNLFFSIANFNELIADWDEIPNGAFENCKNLKSITIDNHIRRVNYKAFANCKNLTLAKFDTNNNILLINSDAFRSCESLENADISKLENLAFIGDCAFADCIRLKSIALPDKVSSISFNAFENCYNLETINLNEGLKVIDKNVFRGCISLNNLKLPSTILKIKANAFTNCKSLTDIYVEDNFKYDLVFDGYKFTKKSVTWHCHENTIAFKTLKQNHKNIEII